MRSAICLSVELVYRVSSEKRLVSGPNDVAAGPAEDPLSWLRRVGAAPRRLKRPQAGATVVGVQLPRIVLIRQQAASTSR